MLEILLVDDEAAVRKSASEALRGAGDRVTTASTEAAARSTLDSRVFDVVISDVNLKKGSGLSIFRHVKSTSPTTDVILMTSFGTVEEAVAALKEGAIDYLPKPLDMGVMKVRLERIREMRRLARELAAARAVVAREPDRAIVGKSSVMVQLVDRIRTIAGSDAPVLVTGESGTGKELVAHSLHELGPRAGKPFVVVNCAAFPESLLEAELFGHERGAFTGAMRKRDGRFKAANGGTLFLDEVAEMPGTAQIKLLRVLQDGVLEPLGTNMPLQVDVRVVAATHRNLKERIAQGQFREDLYYRLKVLDIEIPPLRQRLGDLPVLIEHCLRRALPPGAPFPAISPRALAALAQYPFPGNVRELEHAIEHAVVLSRGKEIDIEHFPSEVAGIVALPGVAGPGLRTLAAATKEFEREYLLRALTLHAGKKASAAKALGISRKNLWEKLKAHGIPADPED